MNVLTGNFINIGVGSVENQKSFILARQIKTSDFRTGWDTCLTKDVVDQDSKVIYFELRGSKAENSTDLLKSIGIDKQYNISDRTPKYKPLRTSNDQSGEVDLHFLEILYGDKPDYWDEEYSQHIFTHTGEGTNDFGAWTSVKTGEQWQANKQYYLCQEAGNWYYIVDGSDTTGFPKSLKFYYGHGPLSKDGGKIGEQILKKYLGSSEDDGWWTIERVNPTTHQIESTRLSPAGGHTSGRTQTNTLLSISNFSNFDGGHNGYRNLGSASQYYQSGWKEEYSTTEKKDEWKQLCYDKVDIENVTICQFGRLIHEDREYFGIWVVEPEIKEYIGYKRIVPQSDPPVSNPVATISEGDEWKDLRDYGLFEDPVERNYSKFSYVRFFGIDIAGLDMELNVGEGAAPPPVNPNPNQGVKWPKLEESFLYGRKMGTLAEADESGFHIYCMSTVAFKNLQGMLWNWSDIPSNWVAELQTDGKFDPTKLLNPWGVIFDGTVQAVQQSRIDPLAAIMFARKLPAFVPWTVFDAQSTTQGNIKIAGLDVGIPAYCCGQEVYAYETTIDCSSLATTGSYLDLSPWTTAEIYLPYIGVVQLDPSDFLGGSIKIVYNCAPINGAISAHLFCENNISEGYGVHYGPYEGNAAYEIPIAQKDANAFQRELGYMKAIGTAMSGPIAAIGNSFRTLANNPNEQSIMKAGLQNVGITAATTGLATHKLVDSYLMRQAFRGSSIGVGGAVVTPTNEIYLIVSTPLPLHDQFNENKRYGMSSGKLSTVTAARTNNKKELVSWKYIDLTGVQATEAELDAINRYMIGGVYI